MRPLYASNLCGTHKTFVDQVRQVLKIVNVTVNVLILDCNTGGGMLLFAMQASGYCNMYH